MDSFEEKDLFNPIDRRVRFSGVRKRAIEAEEQDGGALTRAQAKRQKIETESLPTAQSLITQESKKTDNLVFEPVTSHKLLTENKPSTSQVNSLAENRDSDDADKLDNSNQPAQDIESELTKQNENEPRVTFDQLEQRSESPAASLISSNSDYSSDTIVFENSELQAHIYQAFHRHQKIFTYVIISCKYFLKAS